MFGRISELEDQTAAGIVRAVDEGWIPEDTPYSELIRQARDLVDGGYGEVEFQGLDITTGRPRWKSL